MSDPKRTLMMGKKWPFDAPYQPRDDTSLQDLFPSADWAESAARGVLFDLCDRRGVKQGLAMIDYDVRVEIVQSLAAIIRAAAKDAYEVGEQEDGWPGGDIVTVECPNCGKRWKTELPQ